MVLVEVSSNICGYIFLNAVQMFLKSIPESPSGMSDVLHIARLACNNINDIPCVAIEEGFDLMCFFIREGSYEIPLKMRYKAKPVYFQHQFRQRLLRRGEVQQ